jgi:3' exoribonuclease, RNase T-like
VRIYLNAQFASGSNRDRLISVGMVSEVAKFYRVVSDNNAVEHARRSPWMRQHVLARLPYIEEGPDWHWDEDVPDISYVVREDELIDDLLGFVDAHPDPEFWGWQSSFAYVAIRHLFGRLTDRPANFPAWCGELAAKWSAAGKPELPPRAPSGHHALEQADWAQGVDQLLDRDYSY